MTQTTVFLNSGSWIHERILVINRNIQFGSSSSKKTPLDFIGEMRGEVRVVYINYPTAKTLKPAFSLFYTPSNIFLKIDNFGSPLFSFPNSVHPKVSPSLDAPRKAKSQIPSLLSSSKTSLLLSKPGCQMTIT